MDWQRISILFAIGVVAILLINRWGEFQDAQRPDVVEATVLANGTSSQPQTESIPSAVTTASSGSDIPTAAPVNSSEATDIAATDSASPLIRVETDRIIMLIDPLGGDIVRVELPQYLESLDTPDQPLVLLNRGTNTTYIAQSGLIGKNATDNAAGRPVFSSAQSEYQLANDTEQLQVDLNLQQGDVQLIKRFVFTRNSNLVDVQYLVTNNSGAPWQAALYGQIKRDDHVPSASAGIGMAPYLGAALTTNEENFKKIDFDDLDDKAAGEEFVKDGGWIAMIQHYFLSAWIPDQETENRYTLRKSKDGTYLFSFVSPSVTVQPGATGELSAGFYVGAKVINELEPISPYLDLTVDFGWLWFIAKPLFWALQWIESFVGSWGWSIVILTFLIKLAFYQLSATSYRSMAKMRKFQPKMQNLRELYGDDRQKMSQELMKLYRSEKINPLGGCLPILVQMPVFISLYWMLMESVELRHTPFLFWIQDLSVRDPLFILPLIMGATMFIQFKLNPTPPDPTQARIMQMMPFVFTIMFLWFPAGLVLYWVVNNTLSIAQQYVITRQIENEGKKA